MSEIENDTDAIFEQELAEGFVFSQHDYHLLHSYEAVVDGLAALIGPYCEIVLHSLDDLDKSAIKIANGENTGRTVGSPITDLALRMLKDIEGSERNFSRAYFTRAKGGTGTLMKSITVAIRNGDQRIIGLLCINVNLDAPFSQVLAAFMPNEEASKAASTVNFASDVDELVDQTVERTVEDVTADKEVSNNMKNRQIVMDLYEKGIFDIKDAINRVADRLDISKHTVYLYIRQRKTEDSDK
ncbi:transcriptional regulator [Vibrio sp. SS-MA-C1-2]|uniref:helix-turn-helix transcriptional regulator n=1 Tax=Vibrio sp. SS-MA-C1-2 TaxID=2908646 RepID=UPI001F47022E|nr:transcriptional regulator [Vibrio sp. SS-MA-C1-2]UJF19202.1 transcriptional regulator [Vibrio sp. SS-MA-C1-2]